MLVVAALLSYLPRRSGHREGEGEGEGERAMNRSTNGRESLLGGVAGVRNIAAGSQHRRGRSLTRVSPRVADENLDLFSRNRPTLSVASSDESDVSVKLGGVSVGPAKVVAARSKVDDLLLSSDGGKNDYDWLLTPPETPLFSSSNGREAQPTLGAASRSGSFVKSVSNTRPSRLSVTQSEGNHSSRPTRSSSATRPSLSTTQYNSRCSTKSSSILNTSSASVSSYIKPSIPPTRSPSTARNSTPSVRPAASHSTPARLVTTNSTIEKTRPSQNSRSSTPNSRHQIPSNSHSLAARSTSRASTPTRRMSAPSLAAATTSIGQVLSNGRNSAPTSRPCSPGPRTRSSQHPVTLSDFPHETPPNLRTTLPSRPLSAGRSRPGAAVTVKGNTENPAPPDWSRRLSSPISTRGRVVESTARGRPIEHVARGRVQGNSHVELTESRKAPCVSELAMRRPVRTSAPTTESTGFGRTISKKSLDMAIRHMDIKGSAVGIRTIPGTTLFPQSIRSTPAKPQAIHALNGSPSVNVNGCPYISSDGIISQNGNYVSRSPGSGGREEENSRLSAKLGEMDIFESSRYDTILLKEDLKNATWLHNVDDKSDQGPIFDGGFEQLPEPFGPL